MVKKLKISLLGILLLGLARLTVFSLAIPAAPDQRVNDWAGMFSVQTRDQAEEELARYEDKTGTQFVVATFPSLEDEDLEDFSIRLADKWKIGQKGKDNGLILLIFQKEKKARFEVGYGLESQLPDADADRIIRDVLAPSFRQGDYDAGLLNCVGTVLSVLTPENGTQDGIQQNGGRAVSIAELKRFLLKAASVILFIFIFLFIIDIIRFRFYSGSRVRLNRGYSFFEWLMIFGITLFIIKLIFQIALFSAFRGGYSGGRSGFGGGGFSGGGGSFGGGGASGGW